jgi:uncharacterized protein YkwD
MPVRRHVLVFAAVASAACTLLVSSASSARPRAKLTATPAGVTSDTTAIFKWRTFGATRHTLCRLRRTALLGTAATQGVDAGRRAKFKRCASPESWSGLVPGRYTFTLALMGRRGERLADARYTWKVVPPAQPPPPLPPMPILPKPPPPPAPPPPPTPPPAPPPPPASPPPPPPSPAPPPPPPAPGAAACASAPYKYLKPVHPEISADEQQFVNLVNGARQGLGLKPLAIDSRLSLAADSHSYWQDSYYGSRGLSHTGCGGTDPWARFSDAGYSGSYLGEVTLVNSAGANAQTAFNMFKSSPAHWDLLTSANFTQIGVGESTWHWTGDLGAP